MKKLSTLLLAFAVVATSANAQELKSKKGENYLPEKGDWAIGVNANGLFEYVGNLFSSSRNTFGNDIIKAQKGGSFVGKMFTSDKQAYRVVANLAVTSNKVATQFPEPGFGIPNNFINTTENVKNTGFDLSVGLGKEWRRGKTRLQGFYGADAMLYVNSSKTVTDRNNYNTTGTGERGSLASTENTTQKNGMGFGLGVQGFIGAEYFIVPKISMGCQYTWGLALGITGKATGTQTFTDVATPANNFSLSAETSGSSTNFGLGGVGIASMNVTLHF